MTNPESLADMFHWNAVGERGKSGAAKTKRDTRIHEERAEVWDQARDCVLKLLAPKPVEVEITINESPTSEDFLAVAEAFNEARFGNGPGIGKAVLAKIGLDYPDSFESRTAGRKIKTEDWAYTCCYVWEQFSKEDFPASQSRGTGFRSQGNGQRVVELLTRLSEAETVSS